MEHQSKSSATLKQNLLSSTTSFRLLVCWARCSASYSTLLLGKKSILFLLRLYNTITYVHAYGYRVIKLASPSLNYWIVAGSFLMFAAVCVGLEPSSAEIAFRISCFVCNNKLLWKFNVTDMPLLPQQLYSWLFTVGYLLAFGTILAKMWRVYQIFHNQTREKTVGINDLCQKWSMVGGAKVPH